MKNKQKHVGQNNDKSAYEVIKDEVSKKNIKINDNEPLMIKEMLTNKAMLWHKFLRNSCEQKSSSSIMPVSSTKQNLES